MNLKRFKSFNSDESCQKLLQWIEEGCFDALKRKYLKSAILTILGDSRKPNNVLETYTLRVQYPDSALHQSIDAANQTNALMAQLSLSRNDKSVLKVDSGADGCANLREGISKILRSLCVMSQTLQVLPTQKYLSLKLTYYDEATPKDYEPPGFVAADFDIDHLFQGPTSKYGFGRACTPYHTLALSMETTHDANAQDHGKLDSDRNAGKMVTRESQQSFLPIKAEGCDSSEIPANDVEGFCESLALASQVAQAPNSPKVNKKDSETDAKRDSSMKKNVRPKLAKSLKAQTRPPQSLAPNSPPNFPLSQAINSPPIPSNPDAFATASFQMIKCSCGYNIKNNLDLMQCSNCLFWQHVLCSGYISLRDQRLESMKQRAFQCFGCRYSNQPQTQQVLNNLSIFRKALALISSEGFTTKKVLADRLGVSHHNVDTHVFPRLLKGQFLLPVANCKYKYKVNECGKQLKDQIKFYFDQNLEIHEEFRTAQLKDLKMSIAPKSKTEDSLSQFQKPASVVKIPWSSASTPVATIATTPPVSTGSPVKKKMRKMSVTNEKLPCYFSK